MPGLAAVELPQGCSSMCSALLSSSISTTELQRTDLQALMGS